MFASNRGIHLKVLTFPSAQLVIIKCLCRLRKNFGHREPRHLVLLPRHKLGSRGYYTDRLLVLRRVLLFRQTLLEPQQAKRNMLSRRISLQRCWTVYPESY
jgi:hypothetical protein